MLFVYGDLHCIPQLLFEPRLMISNVLRYFSVPLVSSSTALRRCNWTNTGLGKQTSPHITKMELATYQKNTSSPSPAHGKS